MIGCLTFLPRLFLCILALLNAVYNRLALCVSMGLGDTTVEDLVELLLVHSFALLLGDALLKCVNLLHVLALLLMLLSLLVGLNCFVELLVLKLLPLILEALDLLLLLYKSLLDL